MTAKIHLPNNEHEAELLRKLLVSKFEISETSALEITQKLIKANTEPSMRSAISSYNRKTGDKVAEKLEKCVLNKHVVALVYGGNARFTSCVAKVMNEAKKQGSAEETRLKKMAKTIASIIRKKRNTLKKCQNTHKLLAKFPFLDVKMLEYLSLEGKYDGSDRDSTILATFLNKALRSMKKE